MYENLIEFTMSMGGLVELLGKLSIPYTIEDIDRVNNDIIHIILWRNGKKFRLRFIRTGVGDSFIFRDFVEG